MGFKKRAGRKKPQGSKNRIFNQISTEEERIEFLRNQLHKYNDSVRGFKGNPGSCITDSMLFVKVWNRLWPRMRAHCVCVDLAAQGPLGYQVTLWHKGHDGDDPNYPEPRTNPRFYDPKGATGYDGHIIVKTPNYYVDLTIGQISRSGQVEAPLSTVFPTELAVPITEYPLWIHEMFTREKELQINIRANGGVGTDPNQREILNNYTDTMCLLRPQSVKPGKIAVIQPGKDEGEYTIIAYAIRTDIDFETELAEHRRFWSSDDGWGDERKRHGRGLYKQVRTILEGW